MFDPVDYPVWDQDPSRPLLGWTIVDNRTGRPVTKALFLTRQSAEDHITQWQDRHDRGGRPDISRDLLLHMAPAEVPT